MRKRGRKAKGFSTLSLLLHTHIHSLCVLYTTHKFAHLHHIILLFTSLNFYPCYYFLSFSAASTRYPPIQPPLPTYVLLMCVCVCRVLIAYICIHIHFFIFPSYCPLLFFPSFARNVLFFFLFTFCIHCIVYTTTLKASNTLKEYRIKTNKANIIFFFFMKLDTGLLRFIHHSKIVFVGL